jgi:MoaA/NifB/PqqE/SkfB family radical SAM enzyme
MKGRANWLKFSANSLKNQALGQLGAAAGAVLHKPFFVEFGLSSQCNLRCVHCSQWSDAQAPALGLPQWLEVLAGLRRWMGPFQLVISWGEPTLHAGLLEIISSAAGQGVSTCVVTNGTQVDAALARRLADSGLARLIFSIDGVRAETHDRTRGVSGTFEKAMRGLNAVLALPSRPIVNISTTIHGLNLGEMAPLACLMREKGVEGVRFQPLFPGGEGWRGLWPQDPGLVDSAIEQLLALKRGGPLIMNSRWVLESYKAYFRGLRPPGQPSLCKSYMKLIVRHTGDIYFCRQAEPVGNILRDGPPEQIFRSPRARAALARIVGCAEPCIMMNCHHFNTLSDRAGEMLQVLSRNCPT